MTKSESCRVLYLVVELTFYCRTEQPIVKCGLEYTLLKLIKHIEEKICRKLTNLNGSGKRTIVQPQQMLTGSATQELHKFLNSKLHKF